MANGLAPCEGATDTAAARTAPLGSRYVGCGERALLLPTTGRGKGRGNGGLVFYIGGCMVGHGYVLTGVYTEILAKLLLAMAI